MDQREGIRQLTEEEMDLVAGGSMRMVRKHWKLRYRSSQVP
jgi:hypothetical protein